MRSTWKNTPFLSAAALICSNLLPLYGVIFLRWRVYTVFFIYWLESFIMGLFDLLKMQKAKAAQGRIIIRGIHQGNFISDSDFLAFILFIGGFYFFLLFAYGGFFFLFARPITVTWGQVAVASFLLLLSHSLSYIINFLDNREYDRIDVEKLMKVMYIRGLVIMATVTLGSFFIIFSDFDSPGYHTKDYQSGIMVVLVIMILVKITVDLLGHLKEHTQI